MKRFRIEGMTCQGCVGAVTQAISGAAPGVPFQVTLASGEVVLEDGADVAAVAAAIERAGFQVVERPD